MRTTSRPYSLPTTWGCLQRQSQRSALRWLFALICFFGWRAVQRLIDWITYFSIPYESRAAPCHARQLGEVASRPWADTLGRLKDWSMTTWWLRNMLMRCRVHGGGYGGKSSVGVHNFNQAIAMYTSRGAGPSSLSPSQLGAGGKLFPLLMNRNLMLRKNNKAHPTAHYRDDPLASSLSWA